MSNTKKSFVVGDRYDAFIAKQVAEGRFNNSSEVVRAGLRILEEHENRLAAMRAHVQASLNDPRPRMLVDEGFERLEAIAHKKIRIHRNQNCLKLFVSFSNTKNYLLNYLTKG